MESTFTNVFPKARSNVSIFWTLVILTFIQSIGCGEIRPDWDLAAAHGRQVTFFSTSTASRQDFDIPVPTALTIRGPTSGTTAVTDSNNNEAARNNSLIPQWNSHTLEYLALNLSRQLIFFTSKSPNLSIIAVFNVTSNETYAFHQINAPASINGIVFNNDSLFWTETTSKSIFRLNTPKEISSWRYEIFTESKRPIIRGLTITKSNTLFWVSKSENNVYSIQYYNSHGLEGEIELKNKAHVLAVDATHLYWVYARFHYFFVKRVPLSSLKEKADVVLEPTYQGANALTVQCTGSLAWSDTMKNRICYGNKECGHFHSFTEQAFGLVSKSLARQNWNCKDDEVEDIPTPTLANPPEMTTRSTAKSTPKPYKMTTSSSTTSTPTTQTVSKMFESKLKPSTKNPTQASHILVNDGPIIGNATEEPVNNINLNPSETAVNAVTMSTLVAEGSTIHSTSKGSEEPARIIKAAVNVTQGDSIASPLAVAGHIANNSEGNPIKWCPKEQMNQCLNGGSCVVVGNSLFCLCMPGYTGVECEKQWPSQPPMDPTVYLIFCSSLALLVVILVTAVIILYMKVRRLDKKPKIRRRVIVRSGQRQRGSSVCELIDIENCCNMNECETPCFERGPQTAVSDSPPDETVPPQTEPQPKQPPPKKGKSIKEDKEKLLDF